MVSGFAGNEAGSGRVLDRTRFRANPVIPGIRPVLVGLYLLVLLPACDSQKETERFEDEASLAPAGFTRTDEYGDVLSGDEDDWRMAPRFFGKVRVDPAYPNPVGTGIVTVPVSVLEFDGVGGGLVLRARNSSGRLMILDDIPDAGSPGAYVFQFSSVLLARTGLVRLFVMDLRGELISYGDLMIE
jgi:hypothetical protein